MDPQVKRLVDAVASGHQGGLLPPVAERRGPFLSETRRLSGPADAEVLAAALSQPGFAPFGAALTRITAWGDAINARSRKTVAPWVPGLGNTGLFGPLVTELFTVCAAGRVPELESYCHRRTADWLRHLDDFFDRFARDRPELERCFGRLGPILELTAHGDETHNGGRRVLRLATRGGPALAYKARPACGEAVFLTAQSGGAGPDSVFALLNALTDAPELELPTLRCLHAGEGPDSRLWQEWVEAAPRRLVHREHGLTLSGPVAADGDGPRMWSRAGAVTAAAMAFGIADLIDGNLMTGLRGGDTEPRHHVVDLEVFGRPVGHLSETGLTAAPGPRHHVGFENRPRLCASHSPMAYFRRGRDGLELARPRTAWARSTTDTVVSDGSGRFGYGHHLPWFLRGAFDLWAVLCRHRDEVADFTRERFGTVLSRVVPRDTGEYCQLLYDRLLTGEPLPPDLHESERRQLESGDVPYYLAAPGDDRLSTIDGSAGPRPAEDRLWPGWPDTRGWDLAGLGMTLRGALEFAEVPGPRRAAGVRTGACEVAVDCPEFDSRLVYTWDADTHRVKVADLTEPEPLSEIAERLRRLDDADTVLRTAWVAGGRSDPELAARLDELGAGAVDWLEEVVDEHGWPTAGLVGEPAAAAAVRLLQHVDGAIGFRRRCLRELAAAARDGRAAPSDVAYVTDALCLAEGLPQHYGTKFERVDGELVPCRLADPGGVDAARARMGLSSLAEYAGRVRDRFDNPRPTDPAPGAA